MTRGLVPVRIDGFQVQNHLPCSTRAGALYSLLTLQIMPECVYYWTD
jgi:hypothetical protein